MRLTVVFYDLLTFRHEINLYSENVFGCMDGYFHVTSAIFSSNSFLFFVFQRFSVEPPCCVGSQSLLCVSRLHFSASVSFCGPLLKFHVMLQSTHPWPTEKWLMNVNCIKSSNYSMRGNNNDKNGRPQRNVIWKIKWFDQFKDDFTEQVMMKTEQSFII